MREGVRVRAPAEAAASEREGRATPKREGEEDEKYARRDWSMRGEGKSGWGRGAKDFVKRLVGKWGERDDESEVVWKKESEKREERVDLVRAVGAKTEEDETRKERADWRRGWGHLGPFRFHGLEAVAMGWERKGLVSLAGPW